jgi:hypothetical protein
MPCGHFQRGPVQWAGGGHEGGELTDGENGENRHGKRPTTCFVKKLRAWSLSPCDGSPPVMLSRWLSPRDGFKVARSQGFMVAWSNGPRSQSTTHKHGAQTRQVQFFFKPTQESARRASLTQFAACRAAEKSRATSWGNFALFKRSLPPHHCILRNKQQLGSESSDLNLERRREKFY